MTVNDMAAPAASDSAAESASQVNGGADRGPEDNPLHQTNNSFKWTPKQKDEADGEELVCNLCPELQKVTSFNTFLRNISIMLNFYFY